MPLNKQTGNMYPFVTHTWNPIRGKCPHDCIYCYMKVWKQNPLDIHEKEFSTDLGNGNYIFVGSSTDMWSLPVLDEWIDSTLEHCRNYPQNTYLFQSKNPLRFIDWENDFPPTTILATTIESNRSLIQPNCPSPTERVGAMVGITNRKTVTIEPIMDFDLDVMVDWIKQIAPKFVSIGADSKGHHLPEPSGDKIRALIAELEEITQAKQKDNLKRLLRQESPSLGGRGK